ncbi:hypothetical protein D046_1143, partial [Vibrio parahaemolyticus V-223/04]
MHILHSLIQVEAYRVQQPLHAWLAPALDRLRLYPHKIGLFVLLT